MTVVDEPGAVIWIAAMLAAVVGPWLFFAWRRRAFRLTIRSLLLAVGLVALACVMLRDEMADFDQLVRRPDFVTRVLVVQLLFIGSWITCLLMDGVPAFIRRRNER